MLEARKAIYPDFQPAPSQYHAPLYPERKKKTRLVSPGKKATLLFMVAACFMLGLAVIAQYSSIVSLNYQLSRCEMRLGELTEEYRALELEAASLSSLSRIDEIARNELGMREPDLSQIRILTADREDGVIMEE